MTLLKDYKGGVFFNAYSRTNRSSIIILCSCGNKRHTNRYVDKQCPSCENYLFSYINHPSKNMKIICSGDFECIEKTNNSFKLMKKEIVVHIKCNKTDSFRVNENDYSIEFHKGKTYVFEYSLKDKIMNLYKDGELISTGEKGAEKFFKGDISRNDIVDKIASNNNVNFWKFAYDRFGKQGYERSYKWSRALNRLFDNPYLEILSNCGLDKVEVFDYAIRISNYRINKTKPHEILGIPKYMLKIIKQDNLVVNSSLINTFNTLDQELGSNNFKTIYQIFKEESDTNILHYSHDLIIELVKVYGYRDIKKLCLYVTREVKLQQGISSPNTSLSLLRDYVRMSKDLRTSHEKYPKSLKKVHDIAVMNYNAYKDEIKDRKVKEIVSEEDYSNLAYKGSKNDKFSICIPQSASDVINEGKSLSHCVASYVDDIIKKKCKILFLRYKDKTEEPLVTIEIRDGTIRQVRGQFNRMYTDEEYNFVQKWAERKEIKLGIH